MLLVNAGLAFYGLSVYLNAFSKEQDWPLSSISFAVTIFFIVGGLFGLVAARLIARYDVRAVIIAGASSAAARSPRSVRSPRSGSCTSPTPCSPSGTRCAGWSRPRPS